MTKTTNNQQRTLFKTKPNKAKVNIGKMYTQATLSQRIMTKAKNLRLSAGRFSRKTQQRFEVTFYPGPVQDYMQNHQNNKQNSQIKMDIAPFVPVHRPQVSHLLIDEFAATASTEASAATSTAGRQNVLHNKAGNRQTQQIDEADDIKNKIYSCTFHHANI